MAGTRQIPVELIVNGQSVDKQLIEADGSVHDLEFRYTPDRSSWVAIRVFPAAHTNPVFVEVDGAPIRASKRSAQWCVDAVDRCWESKSPAIRESEREAAKAAYDPRETFIGGFSPNRTTISEVCLAEDAGADAFYNYVV